MNIEDFYFVEGVVHAVPDVKTGMKQLQAHFEKKFPDFDWATIQALDFEGEIPKLHSWLENLLTTEPPSIRIKAFWFGLFNSVLDDGKLGCILYLSGAPQFDPDDDTGDWAEWEDNSYLPEKRYADSTIINKIYRFNPETNVGFDYAKNLLILGYSCLVVKEIIHSIDQKLVLGKRKRRDIAVGFDSGDFIILDGVKK